MGDTIGREYMRQSQIKNLPPSPQSQGVPQPPLVMAPPNEAALIHLPNPANIKIPPMDLRTAIERRRTQRKYKTQPVTQEELSFLLWCTQGIQSISDKPATMRTVPSAGGRHPFETYLLINQVQGLTPGLYRFAALEHALYACECGPQIAEDLTQACQKQPHIRNSAVTFFWVAVLERTYWRYTQRSYRYIHLDAGHVCQNLYLAAEALDCGVCAIAAFDDDEVNALLGLDGDNMFTTYIASLGKK